MNVHQTFTKGFGRATLGLAAAFTLSAGLAFFPAGHVSAQSSNGDIAFDMEDIRFVFHDANRKIRKVNVCRYFRNVNVDAPPVELLVVHPPIGLHPPHFPRECHR